MLGVSRVGSGTNHGASQTERCRGSGRAFLKEQGEKHCRDQRRQAEEGDAVHYGERALGGGGGDVEVGSPARF